MKRLFNAILRIFRQNRREIMFVLVFSLIFVAAQSLYFFSGKLKFPYYLQKGNAAVSALVINVFTPAENARVEGKTLAADGMALEIAWGCEGIEGIFLIVAALTAYSMRRRHKILGIIAGTFFLYWLNIVRIVALYYTIKYNPALFDLMHMYVGQTFTIFFGVMFFIIWIYLFSSAAPAPAPAPAPAAAEQTP